MIHTPISQLIAEDANITIRLASWRGGPDGQPIEYFAVETSTRGLLRELELSTIAPAERAA